ncbi:MAG TPA: CDP-alcohol phosphatidyltransferase family protein [Beutenbergiaceae bacterium]|nr:CDP-alcohol phosphatidyltransferase family protein [Beutenbergiaceae bacterium]
MNERTDHPTGHAADAPRSPTDREAATDKVAGGAVDEVSDRILTWPNLISALRLLMVPVVAVLIINGEFLIAVAVLALAGVSDWVDGVIARALNQTSQLGRFLDPSADRLFIAVAIIGLAYHDVLPWWLVVAVFARDVVVGLCVPFLVARGFPGFPVHDIGKAGTFALMYAFPFLLLAQVSMLADHWVTTIAWAIGWAAAIWGVYLYWAAGLAYLNQFRAVVAADARSSSQIRPRSASS